MGVRRLTLIKVISISWKALQFHSFHIFHVMYINTVVVVLCYKADCPTIVALSPHLVMIALYNLLPNFWQVVRLLKQKVKVHKDVVLSLDVGCTLDILDWMDNSFVLSYLSLGSLLVIVTMQRTCVSPQHAPSR